jgi:hypothetical protein
MLINTKESYLGKLFQRISAFPWIITLFSVGAILRISGFTVGKLWYDEVFSLEMTRLNFFDMIIVSSQ